MTYKKDSEDKKETVLCLIDFTDASQHALRWATTMAATLKAHLTILYSYRLLQTKTEVSHIKKQAEVEALQKFLQWEAEVLTNKAVEYDFRSEVGFMADRVEAYLNQNQVSMLVIHNAMVKDSDETVRKVIENLTVPLVIVPQQLNK